MSDLNVWGVLCLPEDLSQLQQLVLERGLLAPEDPIPPGLLSGASPLESAAALRLLLVETGLVAWLQPGGRPTTRVVDVEISDGGYQEDLALFSALAEAGITGVLRLDYDSGEIRRILLREGRLHSVLASDVLLWPGSPLEEDLVVGLSAAEVKAAIALLTGDSHPAQADLVAKLTSSLA